MVTRVGQLILGFLNKSLQWLALAMIACYKAVGSIWLGGACRFHPSCSDYAVEAVKRFGVFRGGALAARRVIRCRPGSGFAVDDVPENHSDQVGRV